MRLRAILNLPPADLRAWGVIIPGAVADAMAARQTGQMRVAPVPLVSGEAMIGADVLAHESDWFAEALGDLDPADCRCALWPVCLSLLDRYDGEEAPEPPEWVQILGAALGPVGAEDGWPVGARVRWGGLHWVSPGGGNVSEPGVSGWWRVDGTLLPWVQPTGAHDAYPLGAIVTHNGQTWRSTYANNVWAPGVFGWVIHA
jgi:hypothetical protein